MIVCVGVGTTKTMKNALNDKFNGTPTGFYWVTGVSASQIKDKVDDGFRLIDLEVESTGPVRFSAVFVKNTGEYKSAWWWYHGLSSAALKETLQRHQARIASLEVYRENGAKRHAVVLMPNSGASRIGWWYYTDTSLSRLMTRAKEHGARLIDIDTYMVGGKRRFSGVMIANEGVNASAWWVYSNVTAARVSELLKEHGARLVSIVRRATKRWTVLMERGPGPRTWWYHGLTSAQLQELYRGFGARVYEVEPYRVNGKRHFAALLVNNSNELTTRVGDIMREAADGVVGLSLKQLNGPTLASLRTGFVFEPASLLKTVHLAHAMREVEAGTISLGDAVSWFEGMNGSCPVDSAPRTSSLEVLLRGMMEDSSNSFTQAVRVRFGEANINATAASLGMSDTMLRHRIGCAGDALAQPNQLTLADLTQLHQRFAAGEVVAEPLLSAARDLMLNVRFIDGMIDEEAGKLGVSAKKSAAFKAKISIASKGGSYAFSGKLYRSIGGWISLPYKAGPSTRTREYIFGAFVHAATTLDRKGSGAPLSMRRVISDLLREEVRRALSSYRMVLTTVRMTG